MPQEPPPTTPGPAPRARPRLDVVDAAIVAELTQDGRLSNVALARRIGIPETTCSGRVRALRDRGVITGVRAEVNLEALGFAVQAMVAVRLAGQDRERVAAFGDQVARVPGVLAAYNVSGAEDFVVHLAAESPSALRDLVLDHIASRPGVNHVETSFIFSTHPGSRGWILSAGDHRPPASAPK
ncbi:MAG: Lrp/AsnC family transcriptional regulator [Actinomycetales bacterium]